MSCAAHPSAPVEGCETCRGDIWMNAAQFTAASNARLCDIVLAADKLAEFLQGELDYDSWKSSEYARWRRNRMREALDAYKIVRQGT